MDDKKQLEQSLFAELNGKPEQEAITALQLAEWKVRIVRRDGHAFICTRDYHLDRANLEIVDGNVSKITIG